MQRIKIFALKGILFYAFTFLFLLSCERNKNIDEGQDGRELFSRSAELYQEYGILISNSKDSLSIDSLMEKLEKTITDINFSVPPDTDLKLTEQENDSLFKLMESLIQIKKEKLIELSKIEKDSISESE